MLRPWSLEILKYSIMTTFLISFVVIELIFSIGFYVKV